MLEEPFFEAVKNGWPDLMKAKAAFFSAIALVVTISAVATYGLCTHDIDSANQRATTAEQDRDLARNCRLVSSSQPKCPIDHIYKDHRIEVRTQEKIVPDPKQAAKIDQLQHDLKIALANNKPKPTPSDGLSAGDVTINSNIGSPGLQNCGRVGKITVEGNYFAQGGVSAFSNCKNQPAPGAQPPINDPLFPQLVSVSREAVVLALTVKYLSVHKGTVLEHGFAPLDYINTELAASKSNWRLRLLPNGGLESNTQPAHPPSSP